MPNDADYLRRTDDGTPVYSDTVLASRRKLQIRTSTYAEPPRPGSGIRLGIYQSEAAFGPGATQKNLARLTDAAGHAKRLGVQLLAFPELYVPGYTLDPESAQRVAEPADGPSITSARQLARDHRMGLIVPYAERVDGTKGHKRLYDAIAVIDEHGVLLDSYRKTHLCSAPESSATRDQRPRGHQQSSVRFDDLAFERGALRQVAGLRAVEDGQRPVFPSSPTGASDAAARTPRGPPSSNPPALLRLRGDGAQLRHGRRAPGCARADPPADAGAPRRGLHAPLRGARGRGSGVRPAPGGGAASGRTICPWPDSREESPNESGV